MIDTIWVCLITQPKMVLTAPRSNTSMCYMKKELEVLKGSFKVCKFDINNESFFEYNDVIILVGACANLS